MGVIGLAGVATWLLAAAAAARSVGLAAGRGRPSAETFPRVAAVMGALAVAAGPALGLVFAAGAAAVSDVISTQGLGLGNSVASVATVSTVIPVVALLGPLLVVGAVALAFARPVPTIARTGARPPLFKLYGAAIAARVAEEVRKAAVPSEYRSLFNPRALETAAAGGTPVLWLASLVALAFAVTR
jgi:hypothetical protein